MTCQEYPGSKLLANKKWRLQNLYKITNKNGQEVNFNLNWAQEELYSRFWHQMLILKARQLGVTTFFAISFLDDCFWSSNLAAGIIADKKESSEEIFKKKVKYAYDRMPEWTKLFNSATNDRVGELTFSNGSSYRVSTGFRSGTYQRLLVSEFGKICTKSPDVAREIVTGSLNTVSHDQIVVIESTAEGREGYFYDFSQEAEKLAIEKKKLSAMQQRFFFFPWFKEPSYREKDPSIIIPKEIHEYMDQIERETFSKIDEEQRRWYFLKHKILQDAMKQEYPSTPKEAFDSSNEGLYYGSQMSKLRADGRICRVPYQDYSLVHTSWDIGIDDFTSIFCFQLNPAGEIQIIDYYENRDEAAKHYVDWLTSRKYKFGTHILPHDAANKSAQTGISYVDIVKPILDGKYVVLDRKDCDVFLGIQLVRSMLSRCVFDAEKCSKAIKHLESYRKLWDDRLGCYKNQPFHDEHSHCADSMRYLAVGLPKITGSSKSLEDQYKALRSYWGH
jgi:hypothetical protein